MYFILINDEYIYWVSNPVLQVSDSAISSKEILNLSWVWHNWAIKGLLGVGGSV